MKIFFQTQRLIIRSLQEDDRESYFDMMNNPNVMNPIPLEVMDRKSSDLSFETHLKANQNSTKRVWAIDTKNGEQFIGIAAYLKNSKNEDEIGYRLREQFWGVGYGTEVAKGLINYGFSALNLELITADVNLTNERSVKILDKFFKKDFEFYNEREKCTDRRYKITKDEWENQFNSSTPWHYQ